MLIDNGLLIAITITLAAAAAALCCLLATLVLDALSLIAKEYQKKKVINRRLEKRLEQEILSRQRKILDRVAAQTEEGMAETLAKIQQILEEQLTPIPHRYSKILSQLEEGFKNDYQENRRHLRETTEKYLRETKTDFAGLVEKAAEKINNQLTQQLQTTQTELENYKKEQIQKIDDQIAVLVEKTIYKTLGKGLSREDHLDLIYESLNEAKREEFFNA